MRTNLKYAFVGIFSLIFGLNVSFASDPGEWSPTWKLPVGKRPENVVDQPITYQGDVNCNNF